MTKKLWAAIAALLVVCLSAPAAKGQATQLSRAAGKFNAAVYSYGYGQTPGGYIQAGNTATGTQTITVCMSSGIGSGGLVLPDGRTIPPFYVGAPINIDRMNSAVQETVTPTAVSYLGPAQPSGSGQALCANITGSFSFTHGASFNNNQVASGSFGLQEAMYDASSVAGGTVVVDNSWLGTDGTLSGALPFGNVQVEDTRRGIVQYWSPTPTTATVISAPATLTATTVGFGLNGANTTGGTYTGASTYFVAIACVDVLGNESQPSATFSAMTAGSGTTNQIGFAAPAAQTGCVGYVPYISLAGGSYALAYRVPVATFSNGVATANGVCALTTIETVTPACKITNSSYGQTGVAAIVSALTVNTARIWVGIGGTSSTADVVGNSNARTTYAMTPGNHLGAPGIVTVSQAFSAATAPATTVPAIVGTLHLQPNYMNFPGRTIRICGTITEAAGSTATVEQISFYWDADGSNTTGAGVLLPGPTLTSTLTATPKFQFCQDFTTTVAGAGATAGSIQTTQGYITAVNGAAGTAGVTTPTVPGAATALLNLAAEARIDIDYLHTTGTDGAPTLTNVSVTAIN